MRRFKIFSLERSGPSSKAKALTTPEAFDPKSLLNWFKAEARPLPWREGYDPYQVLISEMMLQQTQIVTALPYFNRWIERWPSWSDLASASEDEVLAAWTGLGYYQRARRLLELAQVVVKEYEGILPQDPTALSLLPGLGPYASEAVAAIAFNRPAFPVDGNVRRVLSRYYGNTEISPSKEQDAFFRARLMPTFERIRRRRELAQALMELGALICKPRQPLCDTCPLKLSCSCSSPDEAMTLPVKKAKPKAKKKWILFVWVFNPSTILLRKRSSSGRFPSQWEPVSAEGESKEQAIGKLSQLLKPELLTDIQWQKPFRRDFTTFHVHWEPGVLKLSKTTELTGYQNIQLQKVKALNLIPVMGEHWKTL